MKKGTDLDWLKIYLEKKCDEFEKLKTIIILLKNKIKELEDTNGK